MSRRQFIRFTIHTTIMTSIITLGIRLAGRWSLILALAVSEADLADSGAAGVISGAEGVANNRPRQRRRLALPEAQSSSFCVQ